MTSTDDVFRGFCKGCVAAPKECPIAGNMTAEQLEQSLYAMIDNLKANPIPVPDPNVLGGGTLITYSLVKATLLRQLYFPILWPSTAKLLAAVAAGSGEALAGGSGSDGGVGGDEAQLGIKCSDVLQRADKLTDVAPILEQRHRLSRFGDTADQVLAQCAQWKLPAKERYDGDFNNVKKTKNPVLIVNNRYDPVTPLVSARNVSQTFEGSVLLEQNGYGVSEPCPPHPTYPRCAWTELTRGCLAYLAGTRLYLHGKGYQILLHGREAPEGGHCVRRQGQVVLR